MESCVESLELDILRKLICRSSHTVMSAPLAGLQEEHALWSTTGLPKRTTASGSAMDTCKPPGVPCEAQLEWAGNTSSMRARAQALHSAAGEGRKDRLLKRLVQFAKGSDGEELGELSSYASYDQVAKGVRRMGGQPSGRQESKDRNSAHSIDSPTPLRTPATTTAASLPGFQSSHSAFTATAVLKKNAAIENLQAFLLETAHDAGKLDPDFNLAGIMYVFKLLFMGTMPWANRVRCSRPAVAT